MPDQIRFARLALDQVAAELDRTAFGGGYLTAERMRFLATKVRDAGQVYDKAVGSADSPG
ncbi:hypothetical protein [Nocardia abscessus]|uniref:Uncharacterized protein n=1 Tax=Nocardia abscessus TaxID=120957 RepID=A0ABS0C1K7_9NOCA|nr:hypothetical protein [Nocardia abscessus]MBF6224262.1 hypothetical protein [Nocardia abscessus]